MMRRVSDGTGVDRKVYSLDSDLIQLSRNSLVISSHYVQSGVVCIRLISPHNSVDASCSSFVFSDIDPPSIRW